MGDGVSDGVGGGVGGGVGVRAGGSSAKRSSRESRLKSSSPSSASSCASSDIALPAGIALPADAGCVRAPFCGRRSVVGAVAVGWAFDVAPTDAYAYASRRAPPTDASPRASRRASRRASSSRCLAAASSSSAKRRVSRSADARLFVFAPREAGAGAGAEARPPALAEGGGVSGVTLTPPDAPTDAEVRVGPVGERERAAGWAGGVDAGTAAWRAWRAAARRCKRTTSWASISVRLEPRSRRPSR